MKNEAELTAKRWNFCADGYNDIIQKEFSEKGEVWVDILNENMPHKNCTVLDVGTGPGFFAMILALSGCTVCGIDCAEEMLAVASENAKKRELNINFRKMDSHNLDFPDNTFDYIVARNATWLMYNPEAAFSEFYRVLKPGGRIMYVDANWPYEDDPELLEQGRIANDNYEKTYKLKALKTYTGDTETNDEFNNVVAFRHIFRPDWDEKVLPKLGFVNIKITKRINERVYPDWKMMLYGYMDLFLITADKE